uniref:Cytochrome P450 CYP76AD7 n=1 Tax=Mirabilis jalapa TaxID=3538 RepID=A0A0U1YJT7_MIRJA|nr:cytochrome P450 CYP76AD7 [Mirabilis jalapa]
MNHVLTIPVIFLLIILIIIHKLIFSSNHKLPPGPKPWPIIGNIHLLGNKPHRSLSKLAKKYGPLISLKLGTITTIVISSPDIAKEMFTKHDLALSARQVPEAAKIADHHLYSIIFLPICPKWRGYRKISTVHLFTNQILDTSQHLRRKKVHELVEYIKCCCENNQVVEIGKAAFTTSLNLLSNTFFSFDLASDIDFGYSIKFKNIVGELSEALAKPNLSDFFPIIKSLDLQGVKKKMEVLFTDMWDVFRKVVEERLSDNSKGLKDDVLDTLLKLVDEQEISLDEVVHFIMDLFSAGTETTLITLEWAMTELLRCPDKMAKAQAEIDQVIDMDGSVQESDIPKLPYIQAIVKEILRLHPATPFLVPRMAEQEVQLCDYYVPKNAQILVNVWLIGRDPSVWSNPETFIPERFLGRDIDVKGQDFELIPFGSGRRICPGMSLGYRMVHLMLANLLHSFDWSLPNGLDPKDLDMEDTFGLTLRKAQPLDAVAHYRS